MPEAASGYEGAYVFAFHKSGSTLVQRMLESYCQSIGIPAFSLFDMAFSQGVSTDAIQHDASVCLQQRGYLFTGFRHFPSFDLDLTGRKTILLVRDPRDMLVSLYYSVRTSHVIPKGLTRMRKRRDEARESDIDSFVLKNAVTFIKGHKRYREALESSNLKVYRYEDVIYEKRRWLADLVEVLDLESLDALIKSVAGKVDVVPDREDEARHIRQVHPGN